MISITVIGEENGIGNPSKYLGWDCLHFSTVLGKAWIYLFMSTKKKEKKREMGKSRANGFFF